MTARKSTSELSPQEVIALCVRKPLSAKPLHLNVRMTGEDAAIYEQLRASTPQLSDSQRIRDSVRTSTYLLATGDPVLQKLGVFVKEPQ